MKKRNIIIILFFIIILTLILSFLYINSTSRIINDDLIQPEDIYLGMEEVMRLDGNFVLLSSNIKLDSEGKGIYYAKIRNPSKDKLNFFGGHIKNSNILRIDTYNEEGNIVDFNYIMPPFELENNETQAFMIQVIIPDDTENGNYFGVFNFTAGDYNKVIPTTIYVK